MATNTIVYIDGFNLYYGAVKNTPWKWLNVDVMCRKILGPRFNIVAIRYFTAHVSGIIDQGTPIRQQTYLRALRTIPYLTITTGHFLAHKRPAPLADHPQWLVNILRTEEKGSDVNLATELLIDASRDACDCVVVVSNDSDLYSPMNAARNEFGKVVGCINPQRKKPSQVLLKCADKFWQVRRGVLQSSQFPLQLTDAVGTFSRPPEWAAVVPKPRLPRSMQLVQVAELPP